MISLWLDCDPGHDDALALALACGLHEIELVGVSTVHGNSSLGNTTMNAISLLTAYGINVNVWPGAEKPMIQPLRIADRIHGQSGLDGTAFLPVPAFDAQPDHTAVAALADAIESFDGQLSICATGPLTNIALLVLNFPQVLPKIRCLSIMGGGLGVGNWTPTAEFNLWCDTRAANIVLTNEILQDKIVLCPLNMTHRVIATEAVLDRLHKGPGISVSSLPPLQSSSDVQMQLGSQQTPPPQQQQQYMPERSTVRQMLYELLTYFADRYKLKFGFTDGPPIHDAVALVCVFPFYEEHGDISADLDIKMARYKVQVVEQTGPNEGKLEYESNEGGIRVVEDLNVPVFWQIVNEAVNELVK